MGYQSIYDQFRASGLTQAGSLAMLGNFDCESNCISYRLQGDFKAPNYTTSRQYTADVDNGVISKKQFMSDQKGYGLAQWTFWSRKAALYDFCKQRGYSIGDESGQVKFTVSELMSDFPGLLTELKESNDLYQCTKDVCYKFENPAVKNVDARFAAAKRIENEIDLDGGGDPEPEPQPDPQPSPEPTPVTRYWPPRGSKGGWSDPGLCNGMSGPDVSVLQSVLKARGYDINVIDGHFAAWLEDMVKAFQSATGLAADGIVGPLTWGKLLERG